MNPQISRSPSYLVRNSYSYCFRMKVPQELQLYFGKKELRYSLKTGYLGAAKCKARILAGQVLLIFRTLRKGNDALKDLPDEKIQKIVSEYFNRSIKQLEDRWYSDHTRFLTVDDFQNYVNDLDGIKSDIVVDLALKNYSDVEKIVADLLKENGVSGIDKNSVTYKKLCRGILKSRLSEIDIEKKQMLGDYSDNPLDLKGNEQSGNVPVSEQADDSGEPVMDLKTLIDEHLKEKEIEKCAEGTLKEYRNSYRLLTAIIGQDTSIRQINHKAMQEFKSGLMNMPKCVFNSSQYAGKELTEILKVKNTNTISIPTVNLHIVRVQALFEYATIHEYIDRNPAKGLKIKQQQRPQNQRNIFEVDELKTLFSAENFLAIRNPKPYQFWVPVLGLYTGCRIEEICQLHLTDIQQTNGIWYLDINDNGDDKKLKNTASIRVVPLHPFIVESLNFPAFVERLRLKQEKRLFPELNNEKTKYSHYPSRWFSTYKQGLGIDSSKKVFHSFRHTISDNLKQQMVTDSIIDELTGHAIKGESMGRYGKPYQVETLYKEAVLKLDYGIDLSHLKKSRYVIKQK